MVWKDLLFGAKVSERLMHLRSDWPLVAVPFAVIFSMAIFYKSSMLSPNSLSLTILN